MTIHRKAWVLLGISSGWAGLTAFSLGWRFESQSGQFIYLSKPLYALASCMALVALFSILRFKRHRTIQFLIIGALFTASSAVGHLTSLEGLVAIHECSDKEDWRYCATAAEVVEDRALAALQLDAAKHLQQRACRNGAPWSMCDAFTPDDLGFDTYCKLAVEACDKGFIRACESLPMGCESTEVPLQARACRDGDPEACYETSRVLQLRDQKRARSYVKLACNVAEAPDELTSCYELVDRGHATSRRFACERIVDTCRFRPDQACRAYLERCSTVRQSPYSAIAP